MAKGDNSKASNRSFSWDNGALNLNPVSAEGLNSAMRGDIQAGYLRGPTQTEYVGMSDQTKGAMQGLYDTAVKNRGLLNQSADYYKGVLGSGGINADMRSAMDGLGEVRGMYGDMYTRGAAGNPYLNDIIKQTNDSTYADVMASLGSRGAIGSNLHMKELGGALADNESRLRYQDFGDSFSRQGAALAGMTGIDTSLFNMGQTGQANSAAAAGALPGVYDALLTPDRINAQRLAAIDADNAARAAFDPVTSHLSTYSGLLNGNAAGPQPATWMDYLKLGGGLLGAVL